MTTDPLVFYFTGEWTDVFPCVATFSTGHDNNPRSIKVNFRVPVEVVASRELESGWWSLARMDSFGA